MNVRIFWVRAMKCMYAQTRPRFILSSEGVFGGMEFEPMLTPREKSPLPKMSPEEDRTRDTVDSEPKHYQLSYSGPRLQGLKSFCSRQSSVCKCPFPPVNMQYGLLRISHSWEQGWKKLCSFLFCSFHALPKFEVNLWNTIAIAQGGAQVDWAVVVYCTHQRIILLHLMLFQALWS